MTELYSDGFLSLSNDGSGEFVLRLGTVSVRLASNFDGLLIVPGSGREMRITSVHPNVPAVVVS